MEFLKMAIPVGIMLLDAIGVFYILLRLFSIPGRKKLIRRYGKDEVIEKKDLRVILLLGSIILLFNLIIFL